MQSEKREVVIYGPGGEPVPPSRRARALNGGNGRFGGPPYDAADIYGQHLAAWQPYLWSPDGELNIYRDRIVSRVRDLVRNDGWASGAVTRVLDNAVGANLRPVPKPDYRFLASVSGAAFDHVWAKEYAAAVDAHWRAWAVTDLGRYCDAARNWTFGQMMRIGFRHKLIDGDALAVMQWIPERVGRGAARYCTAVQIVDPDRLSNPQLRFDQMTMRGGVEIDRYGAAVAYHIRKAHAGDWFTAAESVTWERVLRETSWGRPIVVHDYEADRAAQHRGGAGILTPVIQRLKMLIKYDTLEVDAAILNSVFAAYVESPFDHEMMMEALEDGEKIPRYQGLRKEFHDGRGMMIGNARIPMLFPGEKINTVAPTRPSSNFKEFEGAVLRNVAAGAGLSAQQISNNWSDVNYSSARGALLEAWKTLARRRHEFAEGFAAPIRAAWLEEAHEVDDLPLPAGAPDFPSARGAYSRCRWMGPGRGWISPVDEAGAAIMRMDGALSTLEDECAEQGLEFEEVLEQRRYELSLFDKYGIPRPEWAGAVLAQRSARQPEAQ
ncbi:MAG TPA: phage portal protein [Xanthobacteraceae bacterium]|nr:phage portal protein [Xanthobacteraceae bacterium]